MRNISWFILGIGSVLIWGHTALFAQDAPRPPVQVVIGPDGVKVIDPKTGNEVPSVVTRIPATKAARDAKMEMDAEKKIDKEALDRARAYLEQLRKQVEESKEAGKGPTKKAANSDAEIERRLERILLEAEELRREIRALQTPKKKK